MWRAQTRCGGPKRDVEGPERNAEGLTMKAAQRQRREAHDDEGQPTTKRAAQCRRRDAFVVVVVGSRFVVYFMYLGT